MGRNRGSPGLRESRDEAHRCRLRFERHRSTSFSASRRARCRWMPTTGRRAAAIAMEAVEARRLKPALSPRDLRREAHTMRIALPPGLLALPRCWLGIPAIRAASTATEMETVATRLQELRKSQISGRR